MDAHDGQIQYGEELGYESVWLADNHGSVYACMPRLAVVDVISNGRLDFGVGRAFQALEFKNSGWEEYIGTAGFNAMVVAVCVTWSLLLGRQVDGTQRRGVLSRAALALPTGLLGALVYLPHRAQLLAPMHNGFNRIIAGTHARACAGDAPLATGDRLHRHAVQLLRRALLRIG